MKTSINYDIAARSLPIVATGTEMAVGRICCALKGGIGVRRQSPMVRLRGTT